MTVQIDSTAVSTALVWWCTFPASHVSSKTRSSSGPGCVPGRTAARRYGSSETLR
jgi:hypothetical protein